MTDHDSSMVRLRGVRVHNLRDVDVDFPRDALVAVTGVSGSGKSSLAFGTVYAEAQARYLESVAPYARRLIDQAGAPDAREITGLPPAVAFQQARGAVQARSTVGTVTSLSNSLRMLFSRVGTYPDGAQRLDSDAFSPNTPAGACPHCHGLGRIHEVSESSLVPDPGLSINQKAIAAWPGAWQGKNYRDILATLGYDVDRPWRELPQAEREWILFTDEQPVVTVHPEREAGRIQRPYQGTYQSARRYVLHTLATTQSATLRKRALQYAEVLPCPACNGSGLRPEALAVKFAGANVAELAALPLTVLAAKLRPEQDDEVARVIVTDLLARIEALVELGLGYLAMDRTTPTLSAGELQRLRLAATLRSTLFGVVYVLDEPSAGLHPDDTQALLRVLDRIREAGNSLVVVEHEPEVIRHADWLIDVGPGAGEHGGHVLHSGPLAGLADAADSVTRTYLLDPPAPASRDREPTGHVRMRGVSLHNLVETDVDVPLGVFTAVTGVSGSGKTTLVTGVLAAAVRDHLGASAPDDEDEPQDSASRYVRDIAGLEAIKRLVEVDQRPIGRTPRSNLATYTGLFDGVRKLFAATDEARERKYTAGRFSFNVDGGRCETCQGEGAVAVELLFLPSSYSPCPACHGARYNPETLEIRYRDKSIADVLAMTVDEARDFFADVPAVARSLDTLRDVGLSYLTLGQPATELSGGEAQRIKLAAELQRTRRGRTLFVLDEPTTGLHPADVDVLMRLLHALVDAGNTVVVIEHDMSVVAGADHVIDLGPGGGDEGGSVVAAGAPADVARADSSRTAPYLRELLENPL
ncbi:excinuclease ABC subunit UvrA [Saccharopolyspora sp. WRP15-2]|uniref:UvrABC system protein A n=1 Tax=Saccharopolyspora oryzae TaxID=2997343 RepID=A0ABT4V376_9PSEU|nr:excinuclease ABC subunit UvrA [Saccharopolyspora oryzae]MDA3628420.1 excinuclease ABC subunit UvrA [Saccharopolyspora oryzae]